MKTKHIIIIILIAVAIAAVLSTYGDSSSYVYFKEAIDRPNKEFHVVSTLQKDREMVYQPEKDANHFTFYAADSMGHVMKVIYNHPKPSDLERSDKVVLIGKASDDSTFHASEMLLKCPSKYENTLETARK